MLLKLEHGINRLMDWIGAIAAAMLIILVMLVSYNVISRYMFRASLIGLEELSWHLYAAIFLLGIPFALRTGTHVRVDLLYENFSPQTRAKIDLIGTVIFLVPLCLAVIWSGWMFTAEAWGLNPRPDNISGIIKQMVTTGIGEKSQDPGGLLNRWLIKGVIPLSFFLLLLAAVSFFLHRLNVLLGLEQQDETDQSSVQHHVNTHLPDSDIKS